MPATVIHHGRWGRVHRMPSPDHRAVAAERAARYAALVAETVRDADPRTLTHGWVAEQTGVPVGYLSWRYPTVANLHSAGPWLEDRSHNGSLGASRVSDERITAG